MAKKMLKVKVKQEAEAFVASGLCEWCQERPATITAANGKRYCCLAHQSNDKS